MTNRKNFINQNEGFTCLNCGYFNDKASKTCRNHCTQCLYSLHVDEFVPGDRLSNCKNLMQPIRVDQNGKKGFILIHKCLKCQKEISNIIAEDDNWESICKINVF